MRISDWSSDVCSSDLPTCSPIFPRPSPDPQPPAPRRMTMTKRLSFKKYLIASALSLGAAGSLTMALIVPTTPAQAIIVFDPSNYSQNILTAARTLQQINNQIRMRSEEHTSELQSLMRISYAVFCLKKK